MRLDRRPDFIARRSRHGGGELVAKRGELVLEVARACRPHAVRLQRVEPPPALLDLVEERRDMTLVAVPLAERALLEELHQAASRRNTGSASGAAAASGRTKVAATAAPTTSRPVRTTSETRKPCASASGPATWFVAAAAIALTAAIPIAPPICRLVLMRPEAMPASARSTPARP